MSTAPAAPAAPAGPAGPARRSRPHVVVLVADQWRGDVLGYAGDPAVSTPVLDDWVGRDAVAFRNAFCQSPVCTPSRTSFMSGWYPHVRGHRTMHHLMAPDEPVLLRTLKDAGYRVWWGGRNDLVPAGADPGPYCDVRLETPPGARPLRPIFATDREAEWRGRPGSDTYYSFLVGRLETTGDEPYYDKDRARVDGAIEEIRSYGRRRRAAPDADDGADDADDPPLCLYLSLTYPHPPYAVEDPWFSAVDRGALPPRVPPPSGPDAARLEPAMLRGIRERQGMQGWTEERWDEVRATYRGMCARVDHQVGLVLMALREAGLYDESAIFFFADHGDFTGDHGVVEKAQNLFHDCLVRVPFVVKPPAGTPVRPRVTDALVELVDFPATVEAVTGVQPSHTHFGRSLLPVIAGDTDEHRDAVFAEGGRMRHERQAMELESTDGQVPTGLYWPRLSLQATSHVAHTKATMCRTRDLKYVRRCYEPDELYDLRDDPHERRNLIEDPRYERARGELAERMLAWYQETADAVPRETDERE